MLPTLPTLLISLLAAAEPAAPIDAASSPTEPQIAAPPHAPPAPPPSGPPLGRVFALQYTAGVATFIGDLRGPDALFVNDVQAKVLHISTLDDHLRFHLAIDVLFMGATAQGGAFTGYDDGAALGVLSFLFIPSVCGAPIPELQACAGIGQGTVNVNAEGDRRDWGTWNYQVQVDYAPLPWLQVIGLAKYVGAVEQEVDGVESQFSFATLGGGLGVVF